MAQVLDRKLTLNETQAVRITQLLDEVMILKRRVVELEAAVAGAEIAGVLAANGMAVGAKVSRQDDGTFWTLKDAPAPAPAPAS